VPPRLVLAGLGHSHLFILEAAIQGRLPECDLVVCTGEPHHVYSGMVPGWLGGRYAADEVFLPVAPLVKAAGATWRQAHVTGLDPVARTVTLTDGSTEPYDLCSVAVGSVPTGLDLPGAREHAVPLKPLDNIRQIVLRLEALASSGGGNVVVVGGGVAGVEIAFGVAARLRLLGAHGTVPVHIVGREPAAAMDRGARVIRRVQKALNRNGITYLPSTEVIAITPSSVETAAGALPADLVIWATGPAAPAWLAETGLATDERGFLLVDGHLRSVGRPDVLGAGDCATLASHRGTDKAGVYAVRMGPRLVELIRHALGEAPRPKPYTPQRHWLALLNTGDGRAIASRNGFALEGEWAMKWKDRIDREFMGRFRGVVSR
jgi:pyridine nucleotide-disulfide oxidoreductase family protein